MTRSPLGKYASEAALIASFVVLGVWLLLTMLESLVIGNGPNSQLELFAIFGFGILVGNVAMNQQAQQIASDNINGQKLAIQALHRRLDAANVPSAPDVPR